jgi:gluconokinase
MSEDIPLTDEDRWGWLILLRNEAIKRLESSNGVIVTCSALKHRYRDVLRIANYEHPNIQIHFIYLRGDRAMLQERVANRKDHFMKKDMVDSQFDTLEEPEDMERDAMSLDVGGTPEEVQHAALALVKGKLAEYENGLEQ